MPIQAHPAPVAAAPSRLRPPHPTPPRHPLVYALGSLGIEIESKARQASLGQLAEGDRVEDISDLIVLLASHPHLAASLVWTLDIEGRPIYAIAPGGPHAAQTFQRLVRLLVEQEEERIERISLAGRLTGDHIRLPSGATVPVVEPELRGLFGWSTRQLVYELLPPSEASEEVKAPEAPELPGEEETGRSRRRLLAQVLDELYREHQHPGQEPWQRAFLYLLTNPAPLWRAVCEGDRRGLGFSGIGFSRPSHATEGGQPPREEGPCGDTVRLIFFFSGQGQGAETMLQHADIDVGDVVPVWLQPPDPLLGPPLHWHRPEHPSAAELAPRVSVQGDGS